MKHLNLNGVEKKNPRINPTEKRIEALNQLLQLEKSTTSAIPYNQFNIKPNVIYF